MTLRRRFVLLTAATPLAVAMLQGCRAGGQDLEAVNNRLREQNMDLREQVAAMQQQLAELELALRQQPSPGSETVPQDEALAHLPRITKVSLDGLSSVVEAPQGLVVRAYVEPEDGRGRFTQMTGTVTLKLVRVPENADAETVATETYGPAEVRDAYRSGFMGTHYTFEMPVTLPAERQGETWLLIAEYVDAVTGAKLKAERVVEIGGANRGR